MSAVRTRPVQKYCSAPLMLLVFAGACATLAQPSLRTVNRLRDSPHAEGAGPARRIVGRGQVPLEDYVAATILSRGRSARRRHETVRRADVRGAGGARRGPTRSATAAGTPNEGFDVCSTTHCQLYEPDAARRRDGPRGARGGRAHGRRDVVVRRRAGARRLPRRLRRTHERRSAVWGGDALTYLARARRRRPARRVRTWHGRSRRSRAELRDALNADPRTAVGRELKAIEVAGRDGAGRAETVTLRGAAPSSSAAKSSARSHPRVRRPKPCAARCSRSRDGRHVRLLRARLRPRRRPVPGRRAGAPPRRPSPSTRARALFPGTALSWRHAGCLLASLTDPTSNARTHATASVTPSSRRPRC